MRAKINVFNKHWKLGLVKLPFLCDMADMNETKGILQLVKFKLIQLLFRHEKCWLIAWLL